MVSLEANRPGIVPGPVRNVFRGVPTAMAYYLRTRLEASLRAKLPGALLVLE